MQVFFTRLLFAAVWAFGLSGCASAQDYLLRHNPQAGEFTAGYSYCLGKDCPPPETFGNLPKYGRGWHQITVLHTERGLELYRDEQEVPQSVAEGNPLFMGALLMGLAVAVKPADSHLLESAYRLVARNLKNGYMADTVLLKGAQRPQAVVRKPGIQVGEF